jgi:LacI family transcriptional regulator
MASERPTVQQIADHLRLSKFSVARALAGKSGVSDATRARVLRAARQLGYLRHLDASSATTRQVLFVMQEEDGVSSELWMTMLNGAEREGARHGITLIPRQARHLGDLAQLDPTVVGFILAMAQPGDLAAQALQTGLPVAAAGYAPPLDPVDQVVGADWEAGIVVARFLTGLGHRCIGFVQGRGGLFGRIERLRGLRDGAAECPGASVHEIGFDEPGGFLDAFLALVRAGIAPTALFCAHDGLAVTAISELTRLGLRVPAAISVVGFFDFVCATQIVPQLTTIRIPQEEIGVALIRCIAQRLAADLTEQMPPMRLTLTPTFVERHSTAPAAPTVWAKQIAALP